MERLLMARRRPGCQLCHQCKGMTLEAIKSDYLLHSGFEPLITSSASCPMCRLVKDCLRTVIKQFRQRDERGSSKAVSLHPHEVPGKLWVRALDLKLGELHFYAHPDTLATELQLPAAFPDAEHSTLPLLAETLKDCIYSRGRCRMLDAGRRPPPPLLPKRVLDVGDPVGNGPPRSVRLHESSPGERSCYVTLSHRWGRAIPSKTTVANLGTHKRGISYNQLPRTFKDAIITTRKMGFKYVWIDALCIVQDDHDDWASQAPLMGAIFQNAVCTIAAHSAEHSDYGFLSAVQGTEMVQVGLGKLPIARDSIYLDLPRSFEGIISRSHIIQRGWVQQELILPRRLVHFYRGLSFWECPHTTKPEPLGFTAESHIARDWQTHRKRRLEGDAEVSWMEFVSHYSACELTYESDRLVAIDGIAREWMDRRENSIAEHYRYGHFVQNAISLLWAATHEADSKRKDVPSWSWASIEGTVQFMRSRSVGSNYHIPSLSSEINASIPFSKKASSRKKSQLVIRAQTRQLPTWKCRQKKGKFPPWWNVWDGDSPRGFSLQDPFGTVCFDYPPKEISSQEKMITDGYGYGLKLQCVRIATFRPIGDDDGDVFPAFGVLILKPKYPGSLIFRRVGVGMIVESHWFNDNTAFKTLRIE